VSNFCTKCGASIAPESTFCSSCGTPIQAPIAQNPAAPNPSAVPPPAAAPYIPPPVAQAPQAYVPVPMQPVPVQTTSGGGALKIILIVVGVFVLLGVLAASVVGFIGWRVARAVRLDKNGALSIDTPNGTVSAGSDSSVGPSDLGVDAYPGATRGQGSLNLHTPAGSMVSANYTTSDSAGQVVDFYKSKLGSNVNTVETGTGTMLTSADPDAASKIMVTISPQGNKTRISIVHTISKKN
jgi:hypothetical protein